MNEDKKFKPIIPNWIQCQHSKKFWHDHRDHLIESGALNESTTDNFALMCEVWGLMRTADKTESKGRIFYISLLKQFQSLARSFKVAKGDGSIQDIIKEAMNND